MKSILITGGTGLIGRALTQALLQRGYRVIILTRSPEKYRSRNENLEYAFWNPAEKKIDTNAMARADMVIHLAGEPVAGKRWSGKRKQEILDSRAGTGGFIVECLQEIPNHVSTVIGASAIGWYGPDRAKDHTPFTEEDPPSADFLGQTAYQWEMSLAPVEKLKKRLVLLRIGIVISEEGGAVAEFRKPLKFGLATIMGNGRQMVSWIHLDDLVRIFLFIIDHEELRGVYNAVAPNPVTNKELVTRIARKYRGKWFLPFYVPSFVLQLVLGEMSMEVLKSAYVSSKKLQKAGFIFQYPSFE